MNTMYRYDIRMRERTQPTDVMSGDTDTTAAATA